MVVPQVRMGMWVGRVQQRKSGDDRGDRQVVLERQSSVYIVDFYARLMWHTTRAPGHSRHPMRSARAPTRLSRALPDATAPSASRGGYATPSLWACAVCAVACALSDSRY